MLSSAAANWIGLWTLYMREVRRFTKVYMQTILAPLMSTSLFLAVFSLALGSAALRGKHSIHRVSRSWPYDHGH